MLTRNGKGSIVNHRVPTCIELQYIVQYVRKTAWLTHPLWLVDPYFEYLTHCKKSWMKPLPVSIPQVNLHVYLGVDFYI
jgi:hypothetical protein